MPAGQPARSLTVRPGPPLAGAFAVPGDKSVTHRSYLLGMLAEGDTTIENPNPGADCRATLACAAALGARVVSDGDPVVVRGAAMRLAEPDCVLDCGNSGTTLRLLAAPLAAHPWFSVLAGDASLHRRPVGRIVEPLRRMGAELRGRDGDRLPPLAIRGARLRALDYEVPVPSAQVASCVLLAGLFAEGETTARVPGGPRDHTQRMLPAFGVPVGRLETPGRDLVAWSVSGPARPRGIRLRVPGDFSAAAFFLAAAAATPGASVTARDVGLNPTRTGLLAALERMGAKVVRARVREEGGEPVGDVTVFGPERLESVEIASDQVPAMVDEIPAWAVAAAAARGVSRVAGAAELRLKESDRLAALAGGLSRLGLAAEEHPDGLSITGGVARGGEIDAVGDHRVAMAFAVLGTRARAPITVHGAEGIPTSFPGFAGTLQGLGGDVVVVEAASR